MVIYRGGLLLTVEVVEEELEEELEAVAVLLVSTLPVAVPDGKWFDMAM